MTLQDSPPPAPRRIHVSAAVIRDGEGRLLLVRKSGTTAFMQPGGKPEPGEGPLSTLLRELREELQIDLSPERATYLGSFASAAANEPGFVVVAEMFAVDLAGQEPLVGGEIVELRWVTAADDGSVEIAPLAREHVLGLPARPSPRGILRE